MTRPDPDRHDFPITFTIDVGYSDRYDPPAARLRPDHRWRRVIVHEDHGDHLEAQLIATYMVMCRPDCAMVTRTTIVDVIA